MASLGAVELRYDAPWPCALVLDAGAMEGYNRIMTLMLKIKFARWQLNALHRISMIAAAGCANVRACLARWPPGRRRGPPNRLTLNLLLFHRQGEAGAWRSRLACALPSAGSPHAFHAGESVSAFGTVAKATRIPSLRPDGHVSLLYRRLRTT